MQDESRCQAEKKSMTKHKLRDTVHSRYSRPSHKVTFVCVHGLEQSHRLTTICQANI